MAAATENPDLVDSEPVKISDEMVAAGVEVLWQSGAVSEPQGSDELLVAEIFQAMVKAGGQT